ncbi:MAG: hypothetical protein KJ804_20370 [Proteobacteria bacterium]|nr:hypothetical protein [Pseudomonadota bacterium]
MSKTHVAVIIRCCSTEEVLSAVTTLPALDDVQTVLVLLMDSSFDAELNRYAAERGAMILFTQDIRTTFDLPAALKKFDDRLEYVAFWPRRGGFSRAVGLSVAIRHLNETNADIVSGLVRYAMNWQSEAGTFHVVNQGLSLFVAPAELENYAWQSAGAHSLADVDTGGSLLVTKLILLPPNLPLMAESISWGIQLMLAQKDLKALSSKLFTGFQTITSLDEAERKDPGAFDAAILHGFLLRHSLMEVVLFGKGRLIRDDDYQQARVQCVGLLGSEGDEKDQLNLSFFYCATVNRPVIGPLYNIDDDSQPMLVPKWQLTKARKTIVLEKEKTKNALTHSIHNTHTKDLICLVVKRFYRKVIKRNLEK